MNQDGYLEESYKMRNLAQEFDDGGHATPLFPSFRTSAPRGSPQ